MMRCGVGLAGAVLLAAFLRSAAGELVRRAPQQERPVAKSPADPYAAAAPGTVVYRSSFDKGRTDRWTADKPMPVGKVPGALGPLHNQTIRLALAKLPKHTFLHLRLELHIRDTWDGNAKDGDGPDTITIRLANGPTLLRATFAVVDAAQSYPDCGSWASHPAGTGAVKHAGRRYHGQSLYRLAFTFPHTDRAAVLELTGKLSESEAANRTADNESWAVGKVVVSALPASPLRLDDGRFGRLWQALGDQDPVRATEAAWQLVAAGREVLPRIEKVLGLSVDEATAKGIAALIRQLDRDDWRLRQRASEELKKIGKAALPQLRQALAGKPSPEVRSRIEDILSGHTDSAAQRRRAGRARWVLQVIGGPKALTVRRALPEPKAAEPPRPVQRETIRILYHAGGVVTHE